MESHGSGRMNSGCAMNGLAVTMMEEMESRRVCRGGLTSGIPSAHSSGGYGALADGRLLAIGVGGGGDEKLLGGLL